MDEEKKLCIDDDYEDFEDETDEEDTLDEEESIAGLADFDKADELRLLNEESELSLEELRRRYYSDTINVEDNLPKEESEEEHIASSSKTLSNVENIYNLNTNSSLSCLAQDTILEEDEADVDYSPPLETWKNVIRVGSAYQVIINKYINILLIKAIKLPIPKCDQNLNLPPLTDQPLWIPPSPSQCSLAKIKDYLSDCEIIRYQAEQISIKHDNNEESNILCPTKSQKKIYAKDVFDDENALFALYCAEYDVNLAKQEAPFEWPSLNSVNGPRLTYKQPWQNFTLAECSEFENGIRTYGKNFFQISTRLMKHRQPGELVRFYYCWKKSERYDIFLRDNAERASIIANQTIVSTTSNLNAGHNIDNNTNGLTSNNTHLTTGICTPMSAAKNQDRLTNANGLGVPKKVTE